MANPTTEIEKPTTEVAEKATRRRFPAGYKLEILRRADGCHRPGELGALLRSEGLYTSHLSMWRKQRAAMAAAGLAEVRRGRPKADPRDEAIVRLTKDLAQQTARAERAELAVEFQKKVSQILGIVLPNGEARS